VPGGSIYIDSVKDVTIGDSMFELNSATTGGAAISAELQTEIGGLNSLVILNTSFDDNEGKNIVEVNSPGAFVSLGKTSGSGNILSSSCDVHFYYYSSGNKACLSINEEFSS